VHRVTDDFLDSTRIADTVFIQAGEADRTLVVRDPWIARRSDLVSINSVHRILTVCEGALIEEAWKR